MVTITRADNNVKTKSGGLNFRYLVEESINKVERLIKSNQLDGVSLASVTCVRSLYNAYFNATLKKTRYNEAVAYSRMSFDIIYNLSYYRIVDLTRAYDRSIRTGANILNDIIQKDVYNAIVKSR